MFDICIKLDGYCLSCNNCNFFQNHFHDLKTVSLNSPSNFLSEMAKTWKSIFWSLGFLLFAVKFSKRFSIYNCAFDVFTIKCYTFSSMPLHLSKTHRSLFRDQHLKAVSAAHNASCGSSKHRCVRSLLHVCRKQGKKCRVQRLGCRKPEESLPHHSRSRNPSTLCYVCRHLLS